MPSTPFATAAQPERRRLLTATAATLASMACWPAFASEAYPAKPIKIIVPFPPGGPADLIARTVANGVSELLKQPVIVDNRAGGGGTVGTAAIARSPADAYTIGLAAVSSLAIAPHLYKNLPYDVASDLQPLSLAAIVKGAIVAHPSAPFSDVQGLVAYAKAHPRKLNYASSGIGTANHLAGEMFQKMAGVELVHVPYRGTGPATADLIAGVVPLLFESSLLSAAANLAAGKVKVIALTSAERSSLLPSLPTVAEQGYPGFDAPVWFGFVAPKGTPDKDMSVLVRALHTVLKSQDTRERFARIGADPAANSPTDFARYIRSETVAWGALVREKNITIDQ